MTQPLPDWHVPLTQVPPSHGVPPVTAMCPHVPLPSQVPAEPSPVVQVSFWNYSNQDVTLRVDAQVVEGDHADQCVLAEHRNGQSRSGAAYFGKG